MLVSIHISKTAGTSFGNLLKIEYGPRLMLDYGDWVGDNTADAVAHRSRRKSEMMAKRAEIKANFDCIHGHFIADKYQGLVDNISFVTFLRDPYQQALSNYYFLLRNPQIVHPAVRIFHEHKMTITTYLSWEPTHNIQTGFLGEVGLEDFTVVGISEQFSRSVSLFNATFGRKLQPTSFENVNPARSGEGYPIDIDIMKSVKRFRDRDIELYRRACERFELLCARRL